MKSESESLCQSCYSRSSIYHMEMPNTLLESLIWDKIGITQPGLIDAHGPNRSLALRKYLLHCRNSSNSVLHPRLEGCRKGQATVKGRRLGGQEGRQRPGMVRRGGGSQNRFGWGAQILRQESPAAKKASELPRRCCAPVSYKQRHAESS